MRPILFWFDAPLIGRVEFPAYFTLLTIGFAFATWITAREAKRIELDHQLIIDANLWMVVWGLIGARVLHLIADGHFHDYVNLCVNPKLVPAIDPPVALCHIVAGKDPCLPDFLCDTDRQVCYPPKDCFAALEVWRGGLAYYGGFLFAVAFAMYFLRRHKMPIGRVSDLAAPAISLGLFFGRTGCFLNGCCYGKLTTSHFGVRFPGLGVRHPTQLYEALACLAISAFLYYHVRPRKRHDGEMIAGLLILYAIARSVIEIWRDDDRGVFFGGYLSTSQIISIPLFAAGVYLLWRLRRRPALG